jgi:hypothetical protein
VHSIDWRLPAEYRNKDWKIYEKVDFKMLSRSTTSLREMTLGRHISTCLLQLKIGDLAELWPRLSSLREVFLASNDSVVSSLRGLFWLETLDVACRADSSLPATLDRMQTTSALSGHHFKSLRDLTLSYWPSDQYVIDLLAVNPHLEQYVLVCTHAFLNAEIA